MAKPNIIFDTSKFDLFEMCEERFNIRYNLNLIPPSKKPQLDRGVIVHIGNEVYYQALKDGVKYDDAAHKALSKIREAGVTASDLEADEVNRIIDVMEEYYDYWREADENLHIDEVESSFLYQLHEDDEICYHMAGKIDLVVSDNRYTHEPWDHKTRDRIGEELRLSNQFRNYCYALNSNYITINRIGFQKTLKPHEKFTRPRLSYDPPMLEKWKQNVIKRMQLYLICVAENMWPMNETSCDKFHRRCEYYNVCESSGDAARNYKLSTDFIETDEWDVTKVLRRATEVMTDEQKKRAGITVD